MTSFSKEDGAARVIATALDDLWLQIRNWFEFVQGSWRVPVALPFVEDHFRDSHWIAGHVSHGTHTVLCVSHAQALLERMHEGCRRTYAGHDEEAVVAL